MTEQDGSDPWRALQFLTTEHFTLQTARSATIAEANGRANLFVTAVSATLVALGFMAQASDMGMPFLLFGAAVFPGLYFLGTAAFARALQTGIEDALHLKGIARIRHYYLRLAPELRDYFVQPDHDDAAGMLEAVGLGRPGWQEALTTAGMAAVLTSAVGGSFLALVARGLFGAAHGWAAAVAVLGFAASLLLLMRAQRRAWSRLEAAVPPRFPKPGARRDQPVTPDPS
jgi:hypothetical protein